MFRRFDLRLVRLAPAAVAVIVFAQSATLATQDPPLPPGREILAQHVKAIGGEAPYKAVKSIRADRPLRNGRAADLWRLRDDRPRGRTSSTSRSPSPGSARSNRVTTARSAGVWIPSRAPRCLPGKELSEAADDAWFDGALYGSDFVAEATTLGRVTFEGQQAYKVKIVLKSGQRARRILRRQRRVSDRERIHPRDAAGTDAGDQRPARLPQVRCGDDAGEPDSATDGHRADRQHQFVRVRHCTCQCLRPAGRHQSADQVIAGLVLLLCGLAAASVGWGVPPPHGALRREQAPALPQDRTLSRALASFDEVWQTINDTYYDPKFGGLDWKAVRAELRPRPRRAASTEDVRKLIREMLGRLKQSHFLLMSPASADDTLPGPAAVAVELRVAPPDIVITRVMPGSPAEQGRSPAR